MNLAIAQIDTIAGDVRGNGSRILDAIDEARSRGADCCVFPELAITGYAPFDLLQREELIAEAVEAMNVIAREAQNLTVILGTVEPGPPGPGGYRLLRNAAAVLRGGRIVASRAKSLLPAYDVFHEARYFVPAASREPVELAGRRIGLLLGEDMRDEAYPVHPAAELLNKGATGLIVLSASPYYQGVMEERLHHARRHQTPLVYVNGVGGQDGLIFDGGSFALDSRGSVIARLPRFREAVALVPLEGAAPGMSGPEQGLDAGLQTKPDGEPEMEPELPSEQGPEAELFEALCLGLRSFVRKNGVPTVFIGLSGGIDSSLVACLAVEALGPKMIRGIALPTRYTDPRSTETAARLARNLGIAFEVLDMEPLHEAALATLRHLQAGTPEAVGTTTENLQARLRSLVLMAYVNRRRGTLLCSSNKTELALGYGTLYGDMAGSLAPIGDLPKTAVRRLARWIRETRGLIPDFVLERQPTAELKPDQVDPFDYDRIAPLTEAIVEGAPAGELLRRGATKEEIARLDRLLRLSEHKRRQAPLVLKVSRHAFGRGRLMPITHRHLR
jgi:NAD+ synthase (glutamine-hydrolysing)